MQRRVDVFGVIYGNTNWLREVESELGELTVQDNIHIETKKVRKQIRKMPNWKSPGPDGV